MPASFISISSNPLDSRTAGFYRHVMQILDASAVSFLVGGAYAYHHYTGIERHTKDLDLHIRRRDYEQIGDILAGHGYDTDLTYPHWLAKVRAGDDAFVDLIFSSGNGISEVDDEWFEHAQNDEVLGLCARIAPVEEIIWSKAFIMERERYDGADIAHLLRARADRLDWRRLLRRFDSHWRVLLSHLVLFGFIYPAERDLIPGAVMETLLARLRRETGAPAPRDQVCAGTLLSREQYLSDLEFLGYQDGRLFPHGNMSENERAAWTGAIPDRRSE